MAAASGFDVSTKSDGMIERLLHVNRNANVKEKGKVFSFTAYVVVGDGKGRVGLGSGKAKEVSVAIQKANERARKAMVQIELNKGTLLHSIDAYYGAAKVFMKPASKGTGIIAGGPMRAVFEVLGVQNVLAKSIGSSTPMNVVRATLLGLSRMISPRHAANKRGKKIHEILLTKQQLNASPESAEIATA